MPKLEELALVPVERGGWLQRMVRAITLGPWNAKDPALARHFGGGAVSAGVPVNERTAMNYSAVWAAVNLIAGDIGKVPLVLYRKQARAKQRATDLPLYRLIHDRPNPHMGSMQFRRTLQAHALVWGNGYAEIERDQAGRPVSLWPLLPYSVAPFWEGGQLSYRVHNPSGTQVVLPAGDIVHLRGGSDDGIEGWGVIRKAMESLGLGIAAERFGSTFFGNGATFGGIIKYPPGIQLAPQAKDDNRKAIEARHQGVDRAHRLLVLYEGAEYMRLGIPPNEAQFLETRQFQIEEVCRWFNLPQHKLRHMKGGGASYNSIEHHGIEYVTDTLDPWWVAWEQELTMKLIPPLERNLQAIEHVREGMLRGDSAARGEFYSKLFSLGAITPNEIRERENLNPVDGGDTVYVPLNTLPLDRLEEYIDATIESKKPPPVVQAPPKPDEEEVQAARKRAQEAEDARDLAVVALGTERAALLDAVALRDEALARAEELGADVARLAGVERALKADVAAALALAEERGEAVSAKDAELLAVTALRDAAVVQADEARRQAEAQAAACVEAEQAADAARGAEIEAQTAHAATIAELGEARAALEAARAVAAQESQRADAEHQCKVSALGDLIDTAEAAEKREAALTAEAETLKTDLARARADIATELERQQTQRGVMLAAMRSLFVDAAERLLTKESDRARKHQRDAGKLAAWVQTFYQGHEDTVRQAFRPLVGPWTAVTGGAPGVLLERLVREHVETSLAGWEAVLTQEDPDALAGALERTLRRWEDERAEAVADALLREGMGE